jgi:hypothetical protein
MAADIIWETIFMERYTLALQKHGHKDDDNYSCICPLSDGNVSTWLEITSGSKAKVFNDKYPGVFVLSKSLKIYFPFSVAPPIATRNVILMYTLT